MHWIERWLHSLLYLTLHDTDVFSKDYKNDSSQYALADKLLLLEARRS